MMKNLLECIKNKRVNYSQTRELIYKILENSSECLSVQEIVDLANEEYPEYEFEKHKGYGTKKHIEAIKKYGYCHIHRRSYKIKALET